VVVVELERDADEIGDRVRQHLGEIGSVGVPRGVHGGCPAASRAIATGVGQLWEPARGNFCRVCSFERVRLPYSVKDQNALAGMSLGSVTLEVLAPSKGSPSASRNPIRYCDPTSGLRMIMPGLSSVRAPAGGLGMKPPSLDSGGGRPAQPLRPVRADRLASDADRARHPRRSGAEPHEDAFGCPLSFGAPFISILIDASDLNLGRRSGERGPM